MLQKHMRDIVDITNTVIIEQSIKTKNCSRHQHADTRHTRKCKLQAKGSNAIHCIIVIIIIKKQ